MKNIKLVVIIVNYQTGNLVTKSLSSLKEEFSTLDYNIHVYVIDNKSLDDSVSKIVNFIESEDIKDWVTLIKNNVNSGFAAGNNIGIKYAFSEFRGFDYFYFLNPDAFFLPGAIDSIVSFMDCHKDIAVCGSKIENPDSTVRSTVFRYPSILSSITEAAPFGFIRKILSSKLVVKDVPDSPEQTDWVSGAAFILRAPIAKSIGGLDEGYFLYFEELDFMREINSKYGEIWYFPDSRVVHLAGQSTKVRNGIALEKNMPDYWYDSWCRYFQKNHGRLFFIITAMSWVFSRLLYNTVRLLFGKKMASDGKRVFPVLKRMFSKCNI